jgi:FixJ family two-component response regulator
MPIILITGWASIDLAVKGMKLGANDFIHKPWNNDYVLQSIATLLQLNGRKNHYKNQKGAR